MGSDDRLGAGYTLPPELGMVRGIHRQPRLAGGAVVTENGTLSSDDYVPATSGWQISGNGDAEFNELTARGDVIANSFSTGTTGERIEINSGTANNVEFYTGDAAETGPGHVYVNSVPDDSSSNRLLDLSLNSPSVSVAGADYSTLELLSARIDGSAPAQVNLLPHTGGSLGTDYMSVRDTTGGFASAGVVIGSGTGITLTTTGAGSDIILDPADTLSVLGNTSVTGTLSSSGNLSGAAISGSSLSVSGTVSGGSLSTSGSITGGAISATSISATSGSSSLGALSLSGNLTATGSFVDISALQVENDALIKGDLEVDGGLTMQNGEMEVIGSGLGVLIHSPNGSRWRLSVTNAGATVVTSA